MVSDCAQLSNPLLSVAGCSLEWGSGEEGVALPCRSMSALIGSRQRTTKINLAEIGLGPVESGYLSRQSIGAPRTRRIRAIRVESELRFTVRESQSQGCGASLDVREGSMLAMTLLPGA